MARLIDADALMNELQSMVMYENDGAVDCGSYNTAIIDAKAAISSAPTLSPDEVRGVGEWMLLADQNPEDVKAGNYAYWCSRCYAGDVHAKTQEVPYCWRCGARMKGAKDETTD